MPWRFNTPTILLNLPQRVIHRLLLLLLAFPLLAGVLAAQDADKALMLRLGKPVERELAGGQSHVYQIALTARQYAHVVVDQRGVDVVVTLFAPDGKKLVEVDSPNGTQGPEPLSLVANATGVYRLEVRPLEKSAATGRYEAKITELRAGTPQDIKYVAGERAFNKGQLLRVEGTYESLKQAIAKFEEARQLFHSVAATSDEATTLSNLGATYYALDPVLGGDLVHVRQNLGETYRALKVMQKALDYFTQALPLYRAVGNREGEALTLYYMGVVFSSIGKYQESLDNLTQALSLYRAVGDRQSEADMLYYIGLVYEDGGQRWIAKEDEPWKAAVSYQQALSLYRAIGDRRGEAMTMTALGRFGYIVDKKDALDDFTKALPIHRAAGNKQGEAVTLHYIGVVHASFGEIPKALDYYGQSLSLYRAIGDQINQAFMLTELGRVYYGLNEKPKALEYYEQALPLYHAVGSPQGKALTLLNLAKVYSLLGEYKKALDYCEQAFNLYEAVGDQKGTAATLLEGGEISYEMGDKQQALNFYSRAMKESRDNDDRRGEAYALSGIGISLGEQPKALEYLAAARRLMPRDDHQGEASVLLRTGLVYMWLGEKQKALENLTKALSIYHEVGDRQGESVALANIASLERDRGNLSEARGKIESAVALIESLRTKITNQQLRASYFATVQRYYELYINILMSLHKQRPNEGHDGEALQASERSRARTLLESLVEANADIRQGIDPKLVERERALQQRLNAKARVQMNLSASENPKVKEKLKEQREIIAREIEALTTEFQQVESQIRQTSPRYAALTQPQPLTLKEIQTQVLDADTLLLEYSLGKDRSYLWAVTPTSITSYELPKRDEIEAAARRVYDLLNARNQRIEGETQAQRQARIDQSDAQYVEATASLSRMVLAPVAAQMGTKRLLIASDGALQYVPFTALPDPASVASFVPLVVKHEIVSLPSASTISVLRREMKDRKPAAKTVAVLADPVFEDTDERVGRNPGEAAGVVSRRTSRAGRRRELPWGMQRSAEESGLRGAGLEIPRLPGTRLEAEQILALVAASERKQAFDFTANRATAMSVDLSQYRYIHFATHGFLNSLHPELSGIAFSMVDEQGKSQDGFLRAHEVFNLRLPAELVVLSACQTGLGKEVKGEGLVGLTRGFMYAGAPRVVVSLWSVSDAATADLMTRFYRGMLKEGRRPAAALREAQISLLNNKRWESPFYWAAFTLQGEWR